MPHIKRPTPRPTDFLRNFAFEPVKDFARRCPPAATYGLQQQGFDNYLQPCALFSILRVGIDLAYLAEFAAYRVRQALFFLGAPGGITGLAGFPQPRAIRLGTVVDLFCSLLGGGVIQDLTCA